MSDNKGDVLLAKNMARAKVAAESTSYIWKMLYESCCKRHTAKTDQERAFVRIDIVSQVLQLMPILEMVMDYTRESLAIAEQLHDCYDFVLTLQGEGSPRSQTGGENDV